MNTLTIVMIMSLCWMSTWAKVEVNELNDSEASLSGNKPEEVHSRIKRTLFLKKKILGAGLLGFGLGIAKGYKVGYQHSPDIHHVYVAAPPPPPIKYVEYVEKPVFIERIVDRPVEKPHIEYDGPWSQPEPSHVYGYP